MADEEQSAFGGIPGFFQEYRQRSSLLSHTRLTCIDCFSSHNYNYVNSVVYLYFYGVLVFQAGGGYFAD